jgi:AcrR family transcriptional regulator
MQTQEPESRVRQPEGLVGDLQARAQVNEDAKEEMRLRAAEHELPGNPVAHGLGETKRRHIVERASSILFERGFHGTSIRDIAAASDMSMGQLYCYISSKGDILCLMHLYSQEHWYRHIVEGSLEQITDPVAKLEHGLRISIEYLFANRDLFLFLYTESKYMERDHLQRALDSDNRNVVGFYRHLLSEIPGKPGTGTEHELAANLVAFLCTFPALRGWNLHLSHKAAVDAAIESLVDFIFRGLGIDRG